MAASAKNKLCDGVLDCADQSDEAYCGCSKKQGLYWCYKWVGVGVSGRGGGEGRGDSELCFSLAYNFV